MLLSETDGSHLHDLFRNPSLTAADQSAWTSTLEILEERLARHPDDLVNRVALGLAYAVLADYDRAMGMLSPPLDLVPLVTTYLPDRLAVWLGLAAALPEIGRIDEAEALLDAAAPRLDELPSFLRDEHKRLDARLRGNALKRWLRGRARGKRGPGKEYKHISMSAALGLLGVLATAAALGLYLLGPDYFRSRGHANLMRARLAIVHLQNSGQTIESMRKVDGEDGALIPREYFLNTINDLEWVLWLRPDDITALVLEIQAYDGLVSLRPPKDQAERYEAARKATQAHLDEIDPARTQRQPVETVVRVHVNDLQKGEVKRL